MNDPFAKIIMTPFVKFGAFIQFLGLSVKNTIYPPVRSKLFFQQLEFIGNKSFKIVVISSILIGTAFGIILSQIFRKFGVQSMIGTTAAFAFAKELSPIFCAFLVTARAGSAMCAEISTMKVNEQIDAMHIMSVNTHGYLVSPRILASVVMMPLLSSIFTLVGVACVMFVSVALFDLDFGTAFAKINMIVRPKHLFQGLLKASVFGFIITTICCYKGFNAKGGAKGVGQATTQAVVLSLLMILISNFFLTFLQYEQVM